MGEVDGNFFSSSERLRRKVNIEAAARWISVAYVIITGIAVFVSKFEKSQGTASE
jgi:hypothetical protein